LREEKIQSSRHYLIALIETLSQKMKKGDRIVFGRVTSLFMEKRNIAGPKDATTSGKYSIWEKSND